MTTAWPGPLRTPVLGPDFYAKRRIAKWMEDERDLLNRDVDDHDVSEILLKFEKFLQAEEARRMKD